MEKVYSVFVGGVEVNDYLLDIDTAKEVMEYWKEQGYDDVGIVKYSKEDIERIKERSKYSKEDIEK